MSIERKVGIYLWPLSPSNLIWIKTCKKCMGQPIEIAQIRRKYRLKLENMGR